MFLDLEYTLFSSKLDPLTSYYSQSPLVNPVKGAFKAIIQYEPTLPKFDIGNNVPFSVWSNIQSNISDILLLMYLPHW